MEQKTQEKLTIVSESTTSKFKLQISIVSKILLNGLSFGGNYPSSIIYEISTFIFHNPLVLRETMYSLHVQRTIKLNQQYLIKKREQDCKQAQFNISTQNNIMRSDYSSCFITIIKQWKPLHLNQHNYAEVISKGKLFITFFSNIKVQPLINTQVEELNPLNNYKAYQTKQKEKNKQYQLISDNINATHKRFDQIFRYEKDKRINQFIIKSFIDLMSRHIAIVRVQQNYPSKVIGCQGKYIYVENDRKLPLGKKNSINTNFPWLQIKNGIWQVASKQNSQISLYKKQQKPFTRRKKVLINRKLQYFIQHDVWLQ